MKFYKRWIFLEKFHLKKLFGKKKSSAKNKQYQNPVILVLAMRGVFVFIPVEYIFSLNIN